MSRRAPLSSVLFLIAVAGLGQTPQPPAATNSLHIRIVEGDAAINSIRFHRAHDPVVQILDGKGAPVGGVTVTFLLPATGPGGTFDNNGTSLTTQTDQRGLATARGLRPNGAAGQFRIRVTASWRGEAASASISQSNVEPVKSGGGKRIAIIALIGGAALGGVVAATHGGGGQAGGPSTTAAAAPSPSGATIVPGTPSIGPPH